MSVTCTILKRALALEMIIDQATHKVYATMDYSKLEAQAAVLHVMEKEKFW